MSGVTGGATGRRDERVPPEIVAVQDESGDYGHGEWVFIGILWVRGEDVTALADDLRARRDGYTGEIHFYRFPRNFGGTYGAAARVAREWLDLWRDTWAARTWFNVLAVNRRHIRYDHERFARPEVAYPHFTALTLTVGLATFFKHLPAIGLSICSDERSGRTEHVAGTSRGASEFQQELRRALADTLANGYAGPRIAPDEVPVMSLSCEATGDPFTAHQELLQLTDLLLGAASTAILPRSVAATKLWFARELAPILEGTLGTSRARPPDWWRRVRVSYFPDPRGRVYHDRPLGIREQ